MKQLLLLILLIGSLTGNAQSKRDHTWILGYPTLIPGHPNVQGQGGMQMKFMNAGAVIDTFEMFGGPISAVANDTTGVPVFYTNGCSIYNREDEVMENGNDINVGAADYDYFCDTATSTGVFYIRSGNMTLPIPGKVNDYLLLHLRYAYTSGIIGNGIVIRYFQQRIS